MRPMPRICWVAVLVVVALALGVTSAWSSGGGASASTKVESPVRAGKVFAPSRCINKKFEPSAIVYACADFSSQLIQINYQSWGHFKARGSATDQFKNCPNKPIATCNHFKEVDANFKLFRPRYCTNVQHNSFTRLFIHDLHNKPGPDQLTIPFPCAALAK
jgi:hypothetical protein